MKVKVRLKSVLSVVEDYGYHAPRSEEARNVPDFCGRCWHRPYLHRRGDADCGICGCSATGTETP